MPTFIDLVTRDIADAMKQKDPTSLSPLRMLKAALMNREVAKGQALTDADRQGWLLALSARLAQARADGEDAVLSCSALKRAYRDVLRQGAPGLTLIFLHGSRGLLAARIAARERSEYLAVEIPVDVGVASHWRVPQTTRADDGNTRCRRPRVDYLTNGAPELETPLRRGLRPVVAVDVDGHDRASAFYGGIQRGIVREAQIQAEPDEGG